MVQFKTGGRNDVEVQDKKSAIESKEAPPKKVSHYHAQKPPKLWTYTYIATIIWAVGIWLLYPVWPSVSKYTLGALGYSTRVEHVEAVAGMAQERLPNKEWILSTDVDLLHENMQQYEMAIAVGKSAFALNCSQCHGQDGKGSKGFPDLTDEAWLWYSDFEEIELTIKHGIRQPGHDETRFGEMPGFRRDQVLERDEVLDTAHYVLSLSENSYDAERAGRGALVFEENCAACHGYDAAGIPDMGAPNLTDRIWLYGGDLQSIYNTIAQGRSGVMPAWSGRLDDGTIRQLTLYVQSLSSIGR